MVPPPMCTARAVLPAAVAGLAVTSSAQAEHEAVAAALSDGRIALLRSCEEDLWEETLEVCASAGPGWRTRAPSHPVVAAALMRPSTQPL